MGFDKKILIKWTMEILMKLLEKPLDIKEGADILLIKPGIMYLDVLREVKNTLNFLHLVIKINGEYSMLKQAILSGEYNEEDF